MFGSTSPTVTNKDHGYKVVKNFLLSIGIRQGCFVSSNLGMFNIILPGSLLPLPSSQKQSHLVGPAQTPAAFLSLVWQYVLQMPPSKHRAYCVALTYKKWSIAHWLMILPTMRQNEIYTRVWQTIF